MALTTALIITCRSNTQSNEVKTKKKLEKFRLITDSPFLSLVFLLAGHMTTCRGPDVAAGRTLCTVAVTGNIHSAGSIIIN